jgi:hypothetical protein
MIIVYLAHSGSRVVLPDAVESRTGALPDTVDFLDENGRILVTFERRDVALYGREDELPNGRPESSHP